MSPSFFFFFSFFGSYGAWGFPFRRYYLMAMWCVSWPRVTLGLVERFLILTKLFSFPTFFEALPFFCTYFCKISVFLCSLLRILSFLYAFTTVIYVLIPSISKFHFLFQVRPFIFLVLSFLLKFYLLPFSVLGSLFELCFFCFLFYGLF